MQTRCFSQNFGTKHMEIWSVCVWGQIPYEQLGIGDQRKGRNRIFCGIHVVSESEHSGSHELKSRFTKRRITSLYINMADEWPEIQMAPTSMERIYSPSQPQLELGTDSRNRGKSGLLGD